MRKLALIRRDYPMREWESGRNRRLARREMTQRAAPENRAQGLHSRWLLVTEEREDSYCRRLPEIQLAAHNW